MIKKAFLLAKDDLFKYIGYTPASYLDVMYSLQYNVSTDQVEEVSANTTLQTVLGRFDLYVGLVEGITYRLKALEPRYNIQLKDVYLTVVDGELNVTNDKPEDFLETPTKDIIFRTTLPMRANIIPFNKFKENFEK